MKLQQVLDMFTVFGFDREQIRVAMAQGDSAFNAYEGIKFQLQLRWEEMQAELSRAQLGELRQVYDTLQGIKMKSRTTLASKQRSENFKTSILADRMRNRMEQRAQQNLTSVMEMTREQLRQAKQRGELDAAGEARARAAGFFGPDEEI